MSKQVNNIVNKDVLQQIILKLAPKTVIKKRERCWVRSLDEWITTTFNKQTAQKLQKTSFVSRKCSPIYLFILSDLLISACAIQHQIFKKQFFNIHKFTENI